MSRMLTKAAWPMPRAWYAVILCGTLLAYWPALRGTPIWDDNAHVTRPELQTVHGLWRIWFKPSATQQYYPLLHSAFWIEHRIWGDAVIGYHLVNVALHALAACLLVAIVRRLGLRGACFVGLIFALHPVCVESVAWISEQKNTLAAVFYLSAALVYLQFDSERSRSRYILALILFLLALCSKTVAATLPGTLAVVLWWRRGRLEAKRDLLPLAPWFVLGATAGLFTAWVERNWIGAAGPEFGLTAWQRAVLPARALFFYAGKLIWPAKLTFNYPRWTLDPGVTWQICFPAAAILILIVGVWLARRGRRGFLAALLIFAGSLSPVLGFLNLYPFRYSYVADHFQYLASIAVLAPFASAVVSRWARAALLLALFLLTWRQSGIYRDAVTLYTDTLERNPASWFAHNNLATILLKDPGKRSQALAHIDTAIRLNPRYAEAHNDRGNALQQIGAGTSAAVGEYEAALRINPRYAEAHDNLGTALVNIPGRLSEAISHYQSAIEINPTLATAHNNLGNAWLQASSDLPRAVAELELALQLKPEYAEAHNNLGNALMRLPGRVIDAIRHYEAAIGNKADFAEAHNNLGTALLQFPARRAEAIVHYRRAIAIRPDYAGAHNNLGNALALMPGGLDDAMAEYEAALRIQPDFAGAHLNLGAAMLQTRGRRREAIAHLAAAERIRPELQHTVRELLPSSR